MCIDLYQLKETCGLKTRGFSSIFSPQVAQPWQLAAVAAVKKGGKNPQLLKKGKPLIQLQKKSWIYSAERKYVQHIF